MSVYHQLRLLEGLLHVEGHQLCELLIGLLQEGLVVVDVVISGHVPWLFGQVWLRCWRCYLRVDDPLAIGSKEVSFLFVFQGWLDAYFQRCIILQRLSLKVAPPLLFLCLEGITVLLPQLLVERFKLLGGGHGLPLVAAATDLFHGVHHPCVAHAGLVHAQSCLMEIGVCLAVSALVMLTVVSLITTE